MTAQSSAQPRFMREVPVPALPPDLDAAIERRLESSSPGLSGIRIAAASALRRLGLPHSGHEDYSFVRVGEILPHLTLPDGTSPAATPAETPSAAVLAPWICAEARENLIVLLDGVWVPGLSRVGDDFSVTLLEDSAPPESPLPRMHLRFQAMHAAFLNRVEAALEEEFDAPAALASLSAAHPLLIRVPAKRAAAPIQILHLTTGARRSDTFVVIHAGAQSESRILVRHARLAHAPSAEPGPRSAGGPQEAGMENVHTLALIEDGASMRFLEQGIDPSSAGNDLHLRKFSARLERDARLTVVSAHTGSRLTRAAFGIDLAGEGAEVELNGAAVLAGSRQGHHQVRLHHLVPHGTSRQTFKTVAADRARASVDGTITVALDAQQTNAAQLINNLMLSDEARTDTKPRLMIHADDVKCSHGATTGKLDPAQQFYLESRGLPPGRARSLLTVAFIAEALEKAAGIGEAPQGGSFRDALGHALLDALRDSVPDAGTGPSGGGTSASSKPGIPGSSGAGIPGPNPSASGGARGNPHA